MHRSLVGSVAHILMDYFNGKLTAAQAAKIMHVTPRTLYRRAHAFENGGIEALLHGNTGRAPANKFDDEFKEKITKLITTKYKDLTIVEMTKRLNEDGFKVSRETVRRLKVKYFEENSTKKRAKGRS